MQKRITLYREHGHFYRATWEFGNMSGNINIDADNVDDAVTSALESIRASHTEALTSEFCGIPVHFDDCNTKIEVDGNKMLAPNFDFEKFGLTYEQCQYVQRFADVHEITIQESLAAIFKYHKKCGELGMMMIDPPVNKYQEKLPI